LEEHPYTAFTTDYFKTARWDQAAINSAYSGMRYDYGPIGAVYLPIWVLMRWTYEGDPAGTSGQTLELGTCRVPATNGSILTPWNRNYSNISLCNAILQLAPQNKHER